MIIIGEKLNSSIPSTAKAIESYDSDAVISIARAQIDAGADYLDLNTGVFVGEETQRLLWLLNTVQSSFDIPVVIDSPDSNTLEQGVKNVKKGKPIINSITFEAQRYNAVAPIVKHYGAGVIALTMDDGGMPEDSVGRVEIAKRLIEGLMGIGIPLDDIYIDPIIRPVSTGTHYAKVALDTIIGVKSLYPDVHVSCGLSNVSYGLPLRKLLGSTFLIAAIAAGLDAPIMDAADARLMSAVQAAKTLLGQDEYCADYIEKYREGKIQY